MKTKLLLLFLSLGFTALSQTFPTFKADPSTEFTIVTPAAALDQSATGMNASWTFNNLIASGTNIDTYAAPTAPQLSTYPGTTEVLSITSQGGTPTVNDFFLAEDGSGTSITGVSQGDIELNYSSDNAFVGLFPLTFDDDNTDAVAGTFSYQGNNGTFTGNVTITIDAYGTLNLEDGMGGDYTGNVTRLRLDQTLSFSVPPVFNNIGTLNQTTYYYYDNNAANIVFRTNDINVTSGFLGINETTESFERNTLVTLSSGSDEIFTAFKLYPNPSQDNIFIKTGDGEIINNISIIDINGRELYIATQNTTQISVKDFPKGLYFVKIKTESGKSVTKKFMKN